MRYNLDMPIKDYSSVSEWFHDYKQKGYSIPVQANHILSSLMKKYSLSFSQAYKKAIKEKGLVLKNKTYYANLGYLDEVNKKESEAMTLDEADKIRMDFEKFSEITAGKLLALFGSEIPEFLLPYSRERIMQAVEMIAESFKSNGEHKISEGLMANMNFVIAAFVPDEQAIGSAADRFSNQDFLNKYLKKFKEKGASE